MLLHQQLCQSPRSLFIHPSCFVKLPKPMNPPHITSTGCSCGLVEHEDWLRRFREDFWPPSCWSGGGCLSSCVNALRAIRSPSLPQRSAWVQRGKQQHNSGLGTVDSLMQIHVNGMRPAPLERRWDPCLCQMLAPTRCISTTLLDTGCLEDSEADFQQLCEGKLFKWECRKNGKALTL